MAIEILGAILEVRTLAARRGIRELPRLERAYGRARWRKRKGLARVRLAGGRTVLAEVHWYEASGIGWREFKIKRILGG